MSSSGHGDGTLEPTILIIEDDPLAAKILERQLSVDRYQVRVAHNGLDGLRICRAEPPDLVLLDLMLPGVDGFEVLSQLRADPRTADIPVAIVSAKTDLADQEMARRMGANAYLTKPFKLAELLEVVRSLLSGGPARPEAAGRGVLLIGARGGEATPAGAALALGLAQLGQSVALADLRPYSEEYYLMLGVPPPTEPIPIPTAPGAEPLSAALQEHPSGLRLLGKLAGRGVGGQLLADDVAFILNALRATADYVVADIPLYPIELVGQGARQACVILLATRADPASLAAARAAVRLMEHAGLDRERVRLVFVGRQPETTTPGLDVDVLGVVPEGAEVDHGSHEALAERLRQSVLALEEGA